ncbi:hypothetical protein [Brevibacillus centrosporus]|jgi:hypothetical protein|uniref:hypothetical protein n=1 Tax=Brevibacillus centrosporus TaxID=54910 RepID=UPI002E229899|nr:hypothetical protein [Brevibacillus centrosporus]
MKLVLNESDLIKKSLNDGYIDKKPTNTIKLLIKHFYLLGMDKYQVRQSIDSFLNDHLPSFNPVKWDKILDTLVIKAEKEDHKLVMVEKIHITKNELDSIHKIDNLNLEKLAFSYLVYAKIYNQINENQANWVNAQRKDIFQDSKISTTIQKQRLMVNDLINLGLIESSKRRNSGNKKVLFIDEASEVEVTINDFREISLVYLKWKGEKIGTCLNESCRKLYKITGKNHRMCRECWKEHRREQQREWDRNRRKR